MQPTIIDTSPILVDRLHFPHSSITVRTSHRSSKLVHQHSLPHRCTLCEASIDRYCQLSLTICCKSCLSVADNDTISFMSTFDAFTKAGKKTLEHLCLPYVSMKAHSGDSPATIQRLQSWQGFFYDLYVLIVRRDIAADINNKQTTQKRKKRQILVNGLSRLWKRRKLGLFRSL